MLERAVSFYNNRRHSRLKFSPVEMIFTHPSDVILRLCTPAIGDDASVPAGPLRKNFASSFSFVAPLVEAEALTDSVEFDTDKAVAAEEGGDALFDYPAAPAFTLEDDIHSVAPSFNVELTAAQKEIQMSLVRELATYDSPNLPPLDSTVLLSLSQPYCLSHMHGFCFLT